MTRAQTLIATTIFALALPLGVALAQTSSPSTAPVGPILSPSSNLPAAPDNVPSPMQEQAMAPSSHTAQESNRCGPSNAGTMMDEFGRKYNCRGDRLR